MVEFNLTSFYFAVFNPFFVVVGCGLITIGFLGLLFSRKNLIILMLNLELMLLGSGLNYLVSAAFFVGVYSYIFAFFLLAFAAAETAVGLGLLVNLFLCNQSLDLYSLGKLHG